MKEHAAGVHWAYFEEIDELGLEVSLFGVGIPKVGQQFFRKLLILSQNIYTCIRKGKKRFFKAL